MPPQATAVFDLDGTLVDTARDLTATLNRIMVAEGLHAIEFDQARGLVGFGARAMLRRGFELNSAPLTGERLDRLFDVFVADYADRIAEHSRPYPGVTDALDRLVAGGWRLAVCTNKLADLAERLLVALALRDRFAVVAGADTFPVRKPDPGHLTATIAAAGGDPGAAVMIGDSATDIETARAAKVPVIAVDFGYSTVPVRDLAPDAVISDFAALDGAIAELRRNRPGRLT